MRTTIWWVAGALLSMIVPATAGFYSGNELLTMCRANASEGRCLGYLEAIHDGGEENAARLNGKTTPVGFAFLNGYRWCIPNGVASSQLRDVVVKYLKDNPEERQLAAPGQVAAALAKGWPCSK
jgi:hypothetical protein